MRSKFIQSYKVSSQEELAEQELVLATLSATMNAVHATSFSEKFWSDILGTHVRICFRRKEILSSTVPSDPLPLEDFISPNIPRARDIRTSDLLIIARSMGNLITGSSAPKLDSQCTNVLVGKRMLIFDVPNAKLWEPRWPLPLFGNRKKRKKLMALAIQQPNTFLRNVCLRVPRFYVEYFDVILNRLKKLKDVSRLTFHIEHDKGPSRIALAYFREKGAKIVFYQTGSYFGDFDGVPPVSFYRRADVVRTYGQRLNEKDEPYYAVRLEEAAELYFKHAAKRRDIDLLVVYNWSIKNVNLRDHYIEATEYLGANIDKAKYSRVVLRPRGKTRKLSNRSQLGVLRHKITADIDSGMVPLPALCARSTIVLHLEHPTTNFMECVFVDHPVVTLLTNDRPTDLVAPFYDFFLAQGVMHADIASVVEHLNTVNIERWWAEIVQSEQYIEFKRTFTRSKNDYEKRRATDVRSTSYSRNTEEQQRRDHAL